MAARKNASGEKKDGGFPSIKLITPPIQLSYPKIFDPVENDQGKDVWETDALVPPGTRYPKNHPKYPGEPFESVLLDCLNEVMEKHFGDEADWPTGRNDYAPKDKIRYVDPKKLPHPSVDLDTQIFRARSYQPVGVVDADKNDVNSKREAYGGRWAKLSLTITVYDQPKSKGPAIYLNNVQLLDNAESFGGRSSPDQDFEVEESDDERGGSRRGGRDRDGGDDRRSGRGRDDEGRGRGRSRDDDDRGRGARDDDRGASRRGGRDEDGDRNSRRSSRDDEDRGSRSRGRDDEEDNRGRSSRSRDEGDRRSSREEEKGSGRSRDRDDDRGGRSRGRDDENERGGSRSGRGTSRDDREDENEGRSGSRERSRGGDDRGRDSDRSRSGSGSRGSARNDDEGEDEERPSSRGRSSRREDDDDERWN